VREVAVAGIGQTKYSGLTSQSYPELIRRATKLVLEDAQTTVDSVDAVVVSMAPDAIIGVAHGERWIVDACGAAGKPIMRVHTGGATGISAVQVAAYHVASGMYDTVMVVGADRVGESGDAQTILNRIWDPYYERAMPLNTITMLAFQAVRFMEKYGMTEEHMAMVSVKDRGNGCKNPHAHLQKEVTIEEVLNSRTISWPIKLFDSCPSSSGGAAMILTAKENVRKFPHKPAWIRGIGHASETYWMGDRMGPKKDSDHADSPALTQAARAAYEMAGIHDPRREIQAWELYAPFSNIELHAIQDVGLCEPDETVKLLEDGHFDLDGDLPVNPSGGVLCANPISVTAMVRVAEATLQVQGRAGEHQVDGAKTALATGIGGDHQHFGAVVVQADR
jgi:acetyl-CoA C-acetyltransferase